MRTPRDPFSWDGEDEPVPPGDLTNDEESRQILAMAENVVRDAQEAMTREDTDPNLDLRAAWLEATPSQAHPSGAINRFVRPLSRRTFIATLALGCLLAFAHGWHVGATAAEDGRCDLHHCSPDTHIEKWREEKHR